MAHLIFIMSLFNGVFCRLQLAVNLVVHVQGLKCSLWLDRDQKAASPVIRSL